MPPPAGFRIATLIAALVLICNYAFTQIKVTDDGKIGIGTLTPSTPVEINASELIMKYGSSTCNLRMQLFYGSSIVLEPTLNNNGSLGNQNFWGNIRGRHIYYYQLQGRSDSRIKEEVKDLSNSLDKEGNSSRL